MIYNCRKKRGKKVIVKKKKMKGENMDRKKI